MRVCRNCHIVKDESEFRSQPTGDGLAVTCRKCYNNLKAFSRQHRKSYSREDKYGLMETDYLKLLKDCNNRCMICGKETKLVVDHNHSTGKVRGLLCSNCNTGIGFMQDNPVIMKSAYNYLLNSNNKESLEDTLISLLNRR